MDNTFVVADTQDLNVVLDLDDCVVRLTVRGSWDPALRAQAAHRLRGIVAAKPRLLVVDLTELADRAGASAPTWHTAGRYAARQDPPIGVVVAAPPARVRQRLRAAAVGGTLTIADTAADAAPARARPWTQYERQALPPSDIAPVLARTMAGDACAAWHLPHLTHPARLIVHELAHNAVEHAGTDLLAAVSVRGDALHLCVHDHDPALPHLVQATAQRAGELIEQPGTGLRTVSAIATAWGALPCRDGKTVWATLAIDPRPTTP